MKYLLKILFIFILLSGNAFAKIKSKDITFPGKYYTKEIKACSAIPKDKSFSNKSTLDTVRSVVGFDWAKHHTETSNSIYVDHSPITTPIKIMIAATNQAIGNKNQNNIDIAELWGAKVPKNIQEKIFNSVKVVNLAITNPKKFLERKNPNGLARNRITDPKKATPHTHQMAIAIDTLMEIVTGVKLEHDPIYLRKRKMHTPDGIDDLIGFNPNCIIR